MAVTQEQMRVTAVTGTFGDSITVVRAYGGTTAGTFPIAQSVLDYGPAYDTAVEVIQFSLDQPVTAVTGIAITLTGRVVNGSGPYSLAALPFAVSIVKNGGAASVEKTGVFTQIGSYESLTFGGDGDLWNFTSIAAADVIDSATPATGFRVRVRWNKSGPNNPYSSWSTARQQSLYLDAVTVTTYAQPPALVTGAPYPAILLTPDVGPTVALHAYSKGPLATTGDMFEGCLVTNDVANPRRVRWSLPDQIEYLPDAYYIDFPVGKIVAIRQINGVCLIGMEDRIRRLNYLPSTTDPTFSRGRPWEDLTVTHGMVAPQATCTVEWPGRGLVLVYASMDGIYLTDGLHVEYLTNALDWGALVNLTTPTTGRPYLQNAVMVAYPVQKWIAFYFTPPGQTVNTKVLYLHYHPSKVTAQSTPVFTVASVRGGSACAARSVGQSYLLTGGASDGTVYVENQGITDASGINGVPTIRTRQIALAGLQQTAMLGPVSVLHRAVSSTSDGWQIDVKKQDTREAVSASVATATFATTTGGLVRRDFPVRAESVDITLTKNTATTDAEFYTLTLGVDDPQQENSQA